MAIGDCYSVISKINICKVIHKVLGTVDLHTHIRVRPVISFFEKYFSDFSSNTKIRILELGCGCGINGYEIYKIAKKINVDLYYIGVDLSAEAINEANCILHTFQNIKERFSFQQEDANIFLKKYKGPPFDIILLIDVIEHIEHPEETLQLSKNILKQGGFILVSVPTPLYPKIFGKDFALKIGHLVDGYSLSQLDELFKGIDCQMVTYNYNTGIFSNIGCWLYYNKLNFNNKYLNFFKSLILYPFKFLDLYNNYKISCSLFAVYMKK